MGNDEAPERGRVERGGTGQAQGTKPPRAATLHMPPRLLFVRIKGSYAISLMGDVIG
jgi:hypothetical protein